MCTHIFGNHIFFAVQNQQMTRNQSDHPWLRKHQKTVKNHTNLNFPCFWEFSQPKGADSSLSFSCFLAPWDTSFFFITFLYIQMKGVHFQCSHLWVFGYPNVLTIQHWGPLYLITGKSPWNYCLFRISKSDNFKYQYCKRVWCVSDHQGFKKSAWKIITLACSYQNIRIIDH